MKRVLLVLMFTVLVLSPVFAVEKTGFTDLKPKIAVGCSVIGNSASVRIWPTDNLGLELSIALSLAKDYVNLPLTAAMLFPVLEKGNFAVNVAPGIGFTYTQSNAQLSSFTFSAGANILLEMAIPIISENLTIGSGIGAWFSVSSSTGTTTVAPRLELITVSPVMLRYYF